MSDKAPERIWLDVKSESEVWAWEKGCAFEGDVEYIRADLADQEKAEAVGAAYEAAAGARGMWFGFNSQGEPDGSYCTVKAHDPGGMKLYISHEAIRALTNTAATAALKAMKARIRSEANQVWREYAEEGLEAMKAREWNAAIEALQKAINEACPGYDNLDTDFAKGVRWSRHRICKAARALKKPEPSHD